MFTAPNLRTRYTQFFVLFMMGSFLFIMIKSAGSGIANFQEAFYKRFVLIQQATLLRMKIGDRTFPVALMGDNGWMNYTGQGNIDDYQNLRTLDNQEIIGKGLITLNEYLKSEGITLLVTVAPNKPTIYPESVPAEIKSLAVPSRLDNLLAYLQSNNIPVLDLRPALRAANKERDVFYKTDTHWNGYGALVAYMAIINDLQPLFPELEPYPPSDLEYITTGPDVREIPSMMTLSTIKELSLMYAPAESFVQTLHPGDFRSYDQASWIPGSDLPTLLMFHDSFGANYLDNYMSMNFSRSDFVHLESMSQYLTKETIQKFKPDIIIIEIAERNMQDLPLYYPGFMLE
ncbi:MAG: hypothetical protein K8S20_06890 [Chloroflexi bacterium]|nr:hypothetical protein [Chloroflexota bacterium]